MKMWREHSEKLSDYYGWVTNNMEKSWDANLISYNATGINLNKDKFFEFCLQQIQKEMILDNPLYIYLIVLEEVIEPSSKVGRYKKCWKKISDSFEIDYLQLGKAIEYHKNDKIYYVSIARTQIENLEKVLELIDSKKQYRYVFVSRNDYLEDMEKNDMNIDDLIYLNSFDEIDYPQVIEKCINNHDLACCYGSDSIGIELALIFKKHDRNKYWKYANIE